MTNTSKITRRDFVALVGAGLAATVNTLQAQSSGKTYAYVGSWTQGPFGVGGGGGISVFEVNTDDGSLLPLSQTGAEFENLNAGFLCITPDGEHLYSTNEVGNLDGEFGGGGGVLSFSIDRDTGAISHLNTQQSMGVNPAYISIDPTGSRVLTSNHGDYRPATTVVERDGVSVIEKIYDDGTVSMFPVRPDGTLAPASDVAVLERLGGVDPVSQQSPHAHSVVLDPSNSFVVVCDKGADRVYTYRINSESNTFEDEKFVQTQAGIAPRHPVFHPRLPYIFMTNERGSTVSSYQYDPDTAALTFIQQISMIPADFTERNNPSDIKVHPNGKFVYACNRGHNSVAIYSIEEATGTLTLVDIVPSGGSTPRGITFGASGEHVFVANQGSNQVVTFAVNADSGMITPTGATADVLKPACVKFLTV
jgi:6-phosphogluconolactonase